MASPRRKATPKEPKLSLAVALDFIKLAQVNKLDELALRTHCRLASGFAVAFDGVLAIGHPIDEELTICPHTFKLVAALKRCKQAVSITQLDGDKLVIKSDKFRVVIPCLNPAALPYSPPDAQAGVLAPTLKQGFSLLNPLISNTGTTVVEASLLLQNNSMVATDRHIMIEYWHGIELPDGLAIPKVAINALCKIAANPVGIGVSNNTVTFYYENGAWLRTQLYGDKWPDVSRIIDAGDVYNTPDTPNGFFDAVAAVLPHSRDGAVYMRDEAVASHRSEDAGATYEVAGVPPDIAYGAKHLLTIKDVATKFDFNGARGVSYFFGDNVRGAITQRKGYGKV